MILATPRLMHGRGFKSAGMSHLYFIVCTDYCDAFHTNIVYTNTICSYVMHSYSVDASMRVNYTQLLQSVDTLKTVGLVPDKFTVEKLWTSLSGEVNPVITRDITV